METDIYMHHWPKSVGHQEINIENQRKSTVISCFKKSSLTGNQRIEIEYRDHNYHKGSSGELLRACIEGKCTENKIMTVLLFRSVRLQ